MIVHMLLAARADPADETSDESGACWTLALAAEARGPGERKRARALFESALKQYVAELDEMRAMVERAGAGLRLEEDAGKDGMETN